jgi:hypothetical protein
MKLNDVFRKARNYIAECPPHPPYTFKELRQIYRYHRDGGWLVLRCTYDRDAGGFYIGDNSTCSYAPPHNGEM